MCIVVVLCDGGSVFYFDPRLVLNSSITRAYLISHTKKAII